MSFLGGGAPKQKSKSYNKAYGFDIKNFGPTVGMGNAATGMAGDILGLSNSGYWVDPDHDGIDGNDDQAPYWTGGQGGGANGTGNSLGALENYFNSSGGQFQLGQGLDALTSKFSALGLNRSGAAMKGMEQFRHDLVSTKLDNYLGQLNELSRLGLGAGGLITSAGNKSKSSGSGGGGGVGDILGSVISTLPFVLSDRRLKTKIELIRRSADGLGWYRFAYRHAPNEMTEGVMADEVKQLRPAAYVPNFRGEYAGVNYAALGAI